MLTFPSMAARHWILLPWLLALVLVACGNPDPGRTSRYAPALRPEFESVLDDLTQAPQYDMEVWFDPVRNHLEGRLTVTGVNDSTDTWRSLVFRLYPNLRHYGGRMVVERGSIGDTLVPFHLEAGETAAVFLLAQEDWIVPQEKFTFSLRWFLDLPVLPDVSSVYIRFGQSLGFHAAPLFYPALTIYRSSTVESPGGWWMDEGPFMGDVLYGPASLFSVTLYMPPDYPPVANGELLTEQRLSHACPHLPPWAPCDEEHQAECLNLRGESECQPVILDRYQYVAGPSREFTLITHRDYESVSFDVNGVTVTSYWVPAYADTGVTARDFAVAALRIFTEEFGPYPYPSLTVAMAPLANGTMEYPQLNLIGLQLYRGFLENLETQVAFAVAHQWWSQLVHNDPVNEPWLDEAFCALATYIYLERLQGDDQAVLHRIQKWEVPVQYLEDNGRDVPISLRVRDYPTGQDYMTMVYHKGALFLFQLREAMGPRPFRFMLAEIVENHRFGLIDSNILLDYLWKANPTAMVRHQEEFLDVLHQR